FVVHGAELLTEARLHLAPQLRWLGMVFFLSGGRGFHWFLLSHGFALVHLPDPIFPGQTGQVPPDVQSKHVNWHMVPQSLELFSAPFVSTCETRVLRPGAVFHGASAWPMLRHDMVREGFLTTSQAVAQHLPYLRRYARALSGSQASGDAYVAATLEALVQDPKVLSNHASTRIALYQLFTKIWNSVALNGKATAGTAPGQPVERHLSQIAPMPRQAFLLVALEGLSEDDAAKVLDIDVPKLRDLVEQSGRELAAEIATDVLIIEDETFIALDLEGLVESLGHRVL